MSYLPLILAITAVAMGLEVTVFFTFYGLEIIKKGNADNLKVSTPGNP
jgi:peroxiredoxin family protein